MSKKKYNENECNHVDGCDCTPSLFVNMIEAAGEELSRREFIKGVGAMGGMLAFGGFAYGSSNLSQPVNKDAKADAIYHGGTILTMAKDGEKAEALAIANGRIITVGTLTQMMAKKTKETKIINLNGKTLMPGFFDPHSHVVVQAAKFSTANLDPKPIGEAGSIADIQRILKDWLKEKKVEAGKWIIGWGYDDTGITEQRHPNRDDLDAVSTEHPILLMHISSHLMTGNSKMLEMIGINAETKNPKGGVIQRKPNSKEPNGVLEENAMFIALDKMPMPTPENAMEMIKEGLSHYTAAGITTAQDCATFKGTWNILTKMAENDQLPIDVITWPLFKAVDDASFDAIVAKKGTKARLRVGGIKLLVDGSIQGYTAFLSKPYHVQPKSAKLIADHCDTEPAESLFVSKENHVSKEENTVLSNEARGYANMTQEELESWVRRCDENAIQIQAHTNGDAATDMLLEATQKVRGKKPRPDLRTTIVHAQTMRDDQLDFAAKHGLTPSFFPIHVYFWGDRHRDLFLGPQRAARINPARSALDRKLKITLHHDAPIAGVDMLKVAWAAVNRVTSSGKKLGPQECITPFEAFRAITADAAWQNFEEEYKGTLEVGKLADMVILAEDPLSIDSMAIKDIRIMQTIKEGKSVYEA